MRGEVGLKEGGWGMKIKGYEGDLSYAFALLKQAQGSKQRKEQYILSVKRKSE